MLVCAFDLFLIPHLLWDARENLHAKPISKSSNESIGYSINFRCICIHMFSFSLILRHKKYKLWYGMLVNFIV